MICLTGRPLDWVTPDRYHRLSSDDSSEDEPKNRLGKESDVFRSGTLGVFLVDKIFHEGVGGGGARSSLPNRPFQPIKNRGFQRYTRDRNKPNIVFFPFFSCTFAVATLAKVSVVIVLHNFPGEFLPIVTTDFVAMSNLERSRSRMVYL